MAFLGEFRYGDGVLYGALSPLLTFATNQLVRNGGAVHGGIAVNWDVTSLDSRSVMVVARPMRPATVPEEGEVITQVWKHSDVGDVEYEGRAGMWTYFSLFTLDRNYRWQWSAFTVALPVSDWEYGSRILPSLLPGVAVSDDQGVVSAPTSGSLLTEILGEFGFLLDEVKTMAEALSPFWDMKNAVPQATESIAKLLNLEYLTSLGPGVYQDLLAIPYYRDNSLDVLGMKAEAVTNWRIRPRVSNNLMLNMNDSSGEGRIGLWVTDDGDVPERVEHATPYPAILDYYGLSSLAYQRFAIGNYFCGGGTDNPDYHLINVSTWPSIVGGFLARASSGSPVVQLSVWTQPPGSDTETEVVLLQAALTPTWEWYSTDEIIPLSTDVVARPHLQVGPEGAVADIDVILVGPGPSTYLQIPTLHAHAESDGVSVVLTAQNVPSYGTAIIDWGAGQPKDSITWEELQSLGTEPKSYADLVPQNSLYYITARDVRDPLIFASTSVVLPGEVV